MATMTEHSLKVLLSAVTKVENSLKVEGLILKNATDLCLQQMEADSFSTFYAAQMQEMLKTLRENTLPRLKKLSDGLNSDLNWLITHTPGGE